MLNIVAPANAFFGPNIFKLVFILVYGLFYGDTLLLEGYFVYGFWSPMIGFGYYFRVVFDKNEFSTD